VNQILKELQLTKKLILNSWSRDQGKPYAQARILRYEVHPEGLDIYRIRFVEAGCLELKTDAGHIISVLRGKGTLSFKDDTQRRYALGAGVHLYLPPFQEVILKMEPGAELVCVSSPSASQTRGKEFLLRDEMFVAACASRTQSFRWIFTPQYLSRRIFLHHDQTLLSKSGNPVSWFHTTMFDVTGLPKNEEGESVIKMSYNSRTEVNVCYDVKGTARVRMARHPYKERRQAWEPWLPLSGEATYHLNEAAGGPEEERRFNKAAQTYKFFRNKHEVYIVDGHVSLICMCDPAPTGVVRHQPGEYSDYEPLSQVLLRTSLYTTHRQKIASYDEMVERLSLAKATGNLKEFQSTGLWELYIKGCEAQRAIERELVSEANGREKVLARWMQSGADESYEVGGNMAHE